MAELQEYPLTLPSSLQSLHDPYFGFLDLELEEFRLKWVDPAWISTEEAWLSEIVNLDGGEPHANDMLGEDKTRCQNDTTSADGPVDTETIRDNSSVSMEASSDDSPVDMETASDNSPVDMETASDNSPVDTETASDNIPVDTETASDNSLVGTETASDNTPVDTETASDNSLVGTETAIEVSPVGVDTTSDNGGDNQTADNSIAKLSPPHAIAPLTGDVVVKGKADAIDTDGSCDSHTWRKVPSTLRLPSKRKRNPFEGIVTPGDTGADGLHYCHTKKRRRSVPRRLSNEVLILTRSPYDEERHPMDDYETGSSDDNHEAGSSKDNPIDLTE
jgi:hypothetical protein